MLDFVLIMRTKTRTRQKVVSVTGGLRPWLSAVTLLLGIWIVAGCANRSEEVPEARVGTVEAYDVRLDESAAPQQVAYVLLRSLADDVRAAQAFQHDRQGEALERTFALAAYSEIERRILQTYGTGVKWQDDRRNREVFRVVNGWAPIVAHYVASFDTDFETASRKMQVVIQPGDKRADVYYPVCHDPSIEDPAERETVILHIELTREAADEKRYWRVARISYRGLAQTRPADEAKTRNG